MKKINCITNTRIKPKLLREQKTEALLVFIRTTLEQVKYQQNYIKLGSQKDRDYIQSVLQELLENLQKYVVNSSYLQNLVDNSHTNKQLSLILITEMPLLTYYSVLSKVMRVKLQNGSPWMPELLVISLLSEWIIEEGKSTHLYPFLENIDYLHLIEIYDKTKQKEKFENKKTVMNMYKLATILIQKLKSSSYKIQSPSKKRKG
ncbi:hypothetical protein [Poseidonibacter sp.]|uniref:hypothetical protein n=1 Tax=Poseidonibacter sp. TaxID=2321188 RepID=UPI003C721E1F